MSAKTKNSTNSTLSSENERTMFLADNWLNAGRKTITISSASTKAIKVINMDSPKNWRIRALFSAPNTFLTPTSAERLDERAVDKFIKLIQAISKVNMAMDPSTYK